MTKLVIQAIAGLVFLLGVIGAALFGAARTLAFWQAWLFLSVFAGSTLLVTIDLAGRDPALLARRVKAGPLAESSWTQKIIQSLASLSFVAIFVVSGLDHRHGCSQLPVLIVLGGDALVVIGLAIVFLVFRANTFTSAVIEVRPEQQLVSTGPYAVVRHPMYAGALVMLLGTPLALGSWWALLVIPVLVAVIVSRLLDEEKVLATSLPGYAEYCGRVASRLVPHVW